MGIASRLIRLCKADLHGVMDQIEDRELLLKQYLREMEEALAVKKEHLERLMARRTRAERDLVSYRDKVGALEEDIALAVAREKDDIARMLIRKKYPLGQGVENLETRRQHLQAEIDAAEEAFTGQVAALAPHSTLSWALGIWLFFLIQTLFFVVFETGMRGSAAGPASDPIVLRAHFFFAAPLLQPAHDEMAPGGALELADEK